MFDREALIAAVETEMPDVEHYVDLRTGEVLTIVCSAGDKGADEPLDEVVRDNHALARRVRAEPDAFEPVPSIAPEAAFRWMQEFASTIADERLRVRLQKFLHDCTDDCFRAFRRELLRRAPLEERERWFAFRNEKIAEFIDAWLEGRLKDEL